ncbi:hypothetical protein N0V94_005335 [Neodidymelliopsis sp. IMI 364377]|nr:hypothetical protein N0V94_005335 [Neodidymelliopsis sp. IMI 364377]
MATKSPTKASASVEWAPSIRKCDYHLSQHAAYVPRSVLPEADLPGSSHGTARSSTASQQAFHELNNEKQMGVASMLPQGSFPKEAESFLTKEALDASIKTLAEKSSRRGRTVDSSDSTPILEARESDDPEVSVSIAGVALRSTPRSVEIFESDVSSSHLQDLSVDSQAVESCNRALSSTSRATSISTVRAPRVFDDPASTDVAIIYSSKRSGEAGAFHHSNADDECDDLAISAPESGNDLQNTLPIRGRSRQFELNQRHATVGEATPQSTSSSDLRATATEFVPGRNDGCSKVENDAAAQAQILPDMYALDGYGIPWFYHLYPIPYYYPPPPQHVRSRSPKKFRHKKQRWILNKSPERLQNESQGMEIQAETAAFSSAQDTSIEQATTTKDAQDTTDTRDTEYVPVATPCLKPVEGPFSSQLDMVAHQTSLQNHGSTVKPSHVDLTTIRNVPSRHEPTQLNLQGHATIPTRRRTNRQAGNGLYGGRGNAGIPLYATAPFPDPVPPFGGQTEHHSRDSGAYIGYAIATKSCGIIDVEKAAEHGGARACNTCEPDL